MRRPEWLARPARDTDRPAIRAFSCAWQGRCFNSGGRASDVLLSGALGDIAARVPPRKARVLAIVHEDNARSLAVCRRHGFTEELSRNPMSPFYRRLITAHRNR